MSELPGLKILHIDPEKSWGGGESEVLHLLNYLSAWGHENHLLCHPEGRLSAAIQNSEIRTIPFRIRNDLDMRSVPFLRQLIRREQYDIVHFHTKRAHALTLCLGHVWPNVRFIVTRRMDYAVRKNWYHDYLYNRRVDGIIALSRKIESVLIEGGVRREKIRVIYTGVEPDRFQKPPNAHRPATEKLVVGTVGLLAERKGHRFLLEAAALLKGQGYRLKYRFAGEGPEKERLQKLTRELGLKQEVTFDGFLCDVSNFLTEIDIFVLPSLYEGMGVAVLEAMAAAKPVIASRVGGIPELIEDGVSGFLVAPGNAIALAGSLSRLVVEPQLKTQMGMKGRDRVEADFTMRQTAKKIEGYYCELCSHPEINRASASSAMNGTPLSSVGWQDR